MRVIMHHIIQVYAMYKLLFKMFCSLDQIKMHNCDDNLQQSIAHIKNSHSVEL